MVTEKDTFFSLEQVLTSSNMPNPHSRLSASLQLTGQLNCGEERRELEIADCACNFLIFYFSQTHTILLFSSESPRVGLWVALLRGSGVGWLKLKGTLEMECGLECLGLSGA